MMGEGRLCFAVEFTADADITYHESRAPHRDAHMNQRDGLEPPRWSALLPGGRRL